MFMKNNLIDGELDKLLEGRVRKLRHINLKEELEFMENVIQLSNIDGHEVFGE